MTTSFSSPLPVSLTEGPSQRACRDLLAAIAAEPETTPTREALALTVRLMGSYTRTDVGDPAVYSQGIATIIAAYAPWVTRDIAHPLRGLPASLRFLPAMAEVKGWCDAKLKELAEMRARAACRLADFERAAAAAAAPKAEPMTDEQREARAEQVRALMRTLDRSRRAAA
ncbi:hypothetical protein ACJ4V0_15855 [Phreatobacter sp. HK31-P]